MNWKDTTTYQSHGLNKIDHLEAESVKAVLVGRHIWWPKNWVFHCDNPSIHKVLGPIEGDEDGTKAKTEAEAMMKERGVKV